MASYIVEKHSAGDGTDKKVKDIRVVCLTFTLHDDAMFSPVF